MAAVRHGPRGHLLAMRFAALLVINMGCEMVYILDQRLRAQSIAPDKAKKVLQDVVRTMFSARFLVELFKPQEVYTGRATRAIFDRLAHSSIMRLNKNSMDKLYDLMTMGFKFQMLHCVQPSLLVQVTINHLETVRALLADVTPVTDLLDGTTRQVQETYGALGAGDLWQLKHTLCRFFQDRRVKVSLFLQDGLQNMDGTAVLSMTGPLPLGTDEPGTMRYFDAPTPAAAATAARAPAAAKPVRIEVVAALRVAGAVPASERDLRVGCRLGENLYARDRSKDKAAAAAAAAGAGGAVSVTTTTASSAEALALSAPTSPAGAGSAGVSPAAAAAGKGVGGFAAESGSSRASLDLLASLLGGAAARGGATAEDDPGAFKMNLFGDDGTLASGEGSGGGASSSDDPIVFDSDDRGRLQQMMARLGMAAAAPAVATAPSAALGTGDDLLDLMDSV